MSNLKRFSRKVKSRRKYSFSSGEVAYQCVVTRERNLVPRLEKIYLLEFIGILISPKYFALGSTFKIRDRRLALPAASVSILDARIAPHISLLSFTSNPRGKERWRGEGKGGGRLRQRVYSSTSPARVRWRFNDTREILPQLPVHASPHTYKHGDTRGFFFLPCATLRVRSIDPPRRPAIAKTVG